MSGTATAGRGGFAITISAVDTASRQIDAINKRLAAMKAPVDRVQRSLAKFADLTGITKLRHGMTSLARFSARAFENIGRMVPALGAITSAASVAGIFALANNFASFANQLTIAARRIGITTPQLQALENAARLAGSSSEALASGIKSLKDNLTNAVAGRAPEFIAMMNALHVAWQNADGSARKMADVLPEVANKIAALKDPTLQARAATALFGSAGEALLPFLRQGAAGIAELTREAERHGIITEKQAAAAQELYKQQVALRESVEGLGNSVAATLSPVLAPLLKQMSDWIDRNREWIATRIGDAVAQFASYVQSIDWNGVLKQVEAFAHDADSVAQALGGWKIVTEELFALWVGAKAIAFFASVARVVAAFATIRAAATAATAASAAGGAVAGGAAAAGGGFTAAALTTALAGISRFSGIGTFAYMMRPSTTNTGETSFLEQHRAELLLNYFTKQGWTKQQAAAIVAGFQRESKLNSSAIGDNGQAAGIGQWHQDRQAMFQRMFGHSVQEGSLEEQARFAQLELTTTESKAGQELRAAKTPEEASRAMIDYERPRDTAGETSVRTDMTRQLLSSLQTAQAPAATAPPAQVNGGTGSPSVPATTTVKGAATVNIKMSGAPPGTKVTAKSDGDLFSGPPRVEQAMLGAGP